MSRKLKTSNIFFETLICIVKLNTLKKKLSLLAGIDEHNSKNKAVLVNWYVSQREKIISKILSYVLMRKNRENG